MSEQLVLTRQIRRCVRCREDTFWSTVAQLPGQTGLCPDHVAPSPGPDEKEALRLICRTFPGTVAIPEPAEKLAEARTDASWHWVIAGFRWRSHGPRGAQPDERKDHE